MAAAELFTARFDLMCIDDIAEDTARKRFADFKKDGIVKKGCSFDSDHWQMSNEYKNVGFDFEISRFTYEKYKEVFGLSHAEFVKSLKIFVMFEMGKSVLISIQEFLNDLDHLLKLEPNLVCEVKQGIRFARPAMLSDFFSMLNTDFSTPKSENEESVLSILIDAMDIFQDNNIRNNQGQRELADFDTYFSFDHIITEYWNSKLSDDERVFYAPLYIWWKLTTVLPLRPHEFLLMPRDCISEAPNGNYELKIRRNIVKGGNREITYRISNDYRIDTFVVPQYLGKEIQRYIKLTKCFDNTELNTLFVTDIHYKKWKQKKHVNSRYFTYVNMTTTLRYFYTEVIVQKYGFSVTSAFSGSHLAEKQIGRIHLGDARHIALINIMQEGGTPMAAMVLAGHFNPQMAAEGYYSNVTKLIECKTYSEYRRLTTTESTYSISTPALVNLFDYTTLVANPTSLENGGVCHSKAFANGEITDCLKSFGPNSEIGYCPQCPFYRSSKMSFFSEDDIYKRNIEFDCKELSSAIELVRKEKGNLEDIREVLQRIQTDSISYQAYLMEKNKRRDNNG